MKIIFIITKNTILIIKIKYKIIKNISIKKKIYSIISITKLFT